LKILVIVTSFLFLLSITFFSWVYGVSPKLQSELLNNEMINYINYSKNEKSYNKTIPHLDQNTNLDKVFVSSNGTHLEIKLLFNDLLNKLYSFLNSNTTKNNFFINVLIDSDDDETTGFLGYDYRYLLSNNISNSNKDDKINLIRNISKVQVQNYTDDTDILDRKEFDEIMMRIINSKNLVEKIDWVIKGYELLDYDFQPLFYYSKLDEKHLSVIPDGFKITLGLDQIGYPSNYAILIEIGRKSDDYKLSHIFGKVHVPTPILNLKDNTIDIVDGKNSAILEFNNTGLYNFNINVQLANKTLSEGLSINFNQGNNFDLISGQGAIPLDVFVSSSYKQKNLIVPINISYTVLGENDFIDSSFNNSLTNEHIYNKLLYLNFNIIKKNPFPHLEDIPSQYIAVFLGAIFTFFIPSITKLAKEHHQKRTANKFLKNILNEQNSENIDLSIKSIIRNLGIIKHEFIRGKITKDQYEILKENMTDILKNLIDKKNDGIVDK